MITQRTRVYALYTKVADSVHCNPYYPKDC